MHNTAMHDLDLMPHREMLRESGICESAIDTTLEFTNAILRIDNLIFPHNTIPMYIFSEKCESPNLAEYNPGRSNGSFASEECYRIYAKRWEDCPHIFKEIKTSFGSILEEQCVDRSRVLLSIAAHEVRHRVQARFPVLRQFNQAVQESNRFFQGIFQCIQKNMIETLAWLEKEGYTKANLDGIMKDIEYDARFIEHLVRLRPKGEVSGDVLRRLLFSEPY